MLTTTQTAGCRLYHEAFSSTAVHPADVGSWVYQCTVSTQREAARVARTMASQGVHVRVDHNGRSGYYRARAPQLYRNTGE
jgi:hypothetical protein